MKIISSVHEIRDLLKIERNAKNRQIALVPTMGYLHDGHRELIREAKKYCSYVVVSIYVNPLQFGPNEDFDRYPRDLQKDTEFCKEAQVDILFTPDKSDLIGTTTFSYVDITKLDQHLCGKRRPGHFRGVCTIIAKLFNIIQPQYAFFGKKDIQQLKIIQQMTSDLNFSVQIIGVEIKRDFDGLALSSRNKYLTTKERKAALIVPHTVKFIVEEINNNKNKLKSNNLHPNKEQTNEQTLKQTNEQIQEQQTKTQIKEQTQEQQAKEQILGLAAAKVKQEPLAKIDYLEIVDAKLLMPTDNFNQEIIVAVAIYIGKTRLIDNQIIHDQTLSKVPNTNHS